MIKQIKLFKNFSNHVFLGIKLDCQHQRRIVILLMIVLICCIANAIKNLKRGSSYTDSLDWMKRKKETINP